MIKPFQKNAGGEGRLSVVPALTSNPDATPTFNLTKILQKKFQFFRIFPKNNKKGKKR